MTATPPSTSPPAGPRAGSSPGPSGPRSADRVLRDHVGSRVAGLQRGYLADEPSAVQALARLRRAVGSEPGADPSVWALVFEGMPPVLLGHGDLPSAAERAAHDALTVFAVHQQGRGEPVHRPGTSVGTAVRALGRALSAEEAVRRRFEALGTASSAPETLHHLRGLVTQMRGAGVALDYGLLARDLRRLAGPATTGGVRLAWGRDYHRAKPAEPEPASGDPSRTTTDPSSGEQ